MPRCSSHVFWLKDYKGQKQSGWGPVSFPLFCLLRYYGSNTKEYLLFQRVHLHASRHTGPGEKKERWSIWWFKFKGWGRKKKTLLSTPINTFSIIAFKLGSSDRATQNRAHNGHAIPLIRILKTYKPSNLGYPASELTGIWGYRVCSLSSRFIKGNR